MNASFDEVLQRIFLDSSALQTLQTYGEFIYDNVEIQPGDRVYCDPAGIAKLKALRAIMQVAQRGAKSLEAGLAAIAQQADCLFSQNSGFSKITI